MVQDARPAIILASVGKNCRQGRSPFDQCWTGDFDPSRSMRPLRISQAHLMRESEQRVEHAAFSGDAREKLVATRVLGDAVLRRSWTSEHLRILSDVATQRRSANQIAVLKMKSFALVHRKALFEYLRERDIRGEKLRRALALFHSSRCQTDALIAEHGQYLRSACSYLCATHLGSTVVCDGAFQDPFARYEEVYKEYFRAFCDAALAGAHDDEVAAQTLLIPLFKYHVAEQRRAILLMPRLIPMQDRDAALRQPTGDTQKLKRPNFDGHDIPKI